MKSPSAPLIEVHNLSVTRDQPILGALDWTVYPGQHWVILGANGSGKTSLLSALTAYLTPSDGTITVSGQTYGEADWMELRKQIGLVSSAVRQRIDDSELALDVIVSGKYAVINYWGTPKPADKQRARRILRDIECSRLADRHWLHLSQGERQRLLIGRALMADLNILILDEPCAGLDPVAREKFLAFLLRLGKTKHCPALVLVTHHVEEIIPCFTHALLLKNGRVTASGPIARTLTAKNLGQIFDADVDLQKRRGRYQLNLKINSKFIA
ncbi:MAG: ABC transporter ATP-binding protein [Verrucomicrobiales bacterium]|jgi:iron complex transport system ATP-binding protein|nr:ABC transporter ATP-binding protein [Verrucomicrobiales bacterium]